MGVDKCPNYWGFFGHHQNKYLLEMKFPLYSWVMWTIGTFTNLCLMGIQPAQPSHWILRWSSIYRTGGHRITGVAWIPMKIWEDAWNIGVFLKEKTETWQPVVLYFIGKLVVSCVFGCPLRILPTAWSSFLLVKIRHQEPVDLMRQIWFHLFNPRIAVWTNWLVISVAFRFSLQLWRNASLRRKISKWIQMDPNISKHEVLDPS